MNFWDNLLLEEFTKVNPYSYANDLKNKFSHDKSLWYKVILPIEMVEEIYQKSNGDYSQIWEDHCAICYCEINRNTNIDCFLSKDKLTWLCGNCYNKLFNKKHNL